eukprot:m.101398 g.101398  ORF g.101398 m.101398 type:complete len:395 (+) comp15165_c0_seq3:364-1548(+)
MADNNSFGEVLNCVQRGWHQSREGISSLCDQIQKLAVAVFLGCEGVGKTTAIAYILGHELEQREALQEYTDNDGNVVHTTTHRYIGHVTPERHQDVQIGVGGCLGATTTELECIVLDNTIAIIDTPSHEKIEDAFIIHGTMETLSNRMVVVLCLDVNRLRTDSGYLLDQVLLLQSTISQADLSQPELRSVVILFTRGSPQDQGLILDILKEDKERHVLSDRALETYFEYIIQQVKAYEARLFVCPLDADISRIDALRALLLEHAQPKQDRHFGLPIDQKTFRKMTTAVLSTVNTFRHIPTSDTSKLEFLPLIIDMLRLPEQADNPVKLRVTSIVKHHRDAFLGKCQSGDVDGASQVLDFLCKLEPLSRFVRFDDLNTDATDLNSFCRALAQSLS